jgi:hypothetical protein
LLAVAVATAACFGRSVPPGDVDDSTFVAAMADLRRAVQPGGAETMRDSAGRQAIRDSILQHYHMTAAALESTASHLVDRPPARADAILRAIDRKVSTPLPRPAQPVVAPPVTPTTGAAPSAVPAPAAGHPAIRPAQVTPARPAPLQVPGSPPSAAAASPPPPAGGAAAPPPSAGGAPSPH